MLVNMQVSGGDMGDARSIEPFRTRVARSLALPCVSVRYEIPGYSENCHLTSFRTNLPEDGDNNVRDQVNSSVIVLMYISVSKNEFAFGHSKQRISSEYRVFQKELYNFEHLYKFILGTCSECNVTRHRVFPGMVTVQCNFDW
jgi:hypothetical protein